MANSPLKHSSKGYDLVQNNFPTLHLNSVLYKLEMLTLLMIKENINLMNQFPNKQEI